MKVELEFFTGINEIGAASGIHYQEGKIYLIGDNSAYLYEYTLATKELSKIKLFPTDKGVPVENIPKISKPDFESLCFHQDELYILGSGSTNNRNTMVSYCITNQKITVHDLHEVYNKLIVEAVIDQDNLNIEGAIFTGDQWLLFNRGNGSLGSNGVFKIQGETLSPACNVQFVPITLLRINQVLSSFTDAVRLGNKIYFLTTAEDTISTYEDGNVLGSCIGCMNLDTLEVDFIQQFSTSHKFEGITLYQERKDGITFLICEDNDSDERSSKVYKLNYNY